MYWFFYKRKRFRKTIAGIITLMVVICNSCPAQDNQQLPDSVSVSDTVISNEEGNKITTTNTDSTGEKDTAEDIVVLRKIPDSVLAAFKKDKDFQYANDDSYWITKPLQHKKNFIDYFLEWITGTFFRILLYILFGATILFTLYRLIVENKLHMFYSSPAKKITEVVDETSMSFEDIDLKIKEAAASGDLRLCIRYMYLKALKKSGDKGIITLDAQATNQEYINQFANHPGEKEFRMLTHAYEYVWYGGFTLMSGQFESLQAQFNNFYNIIDHWEK
jgi:hypothetical protein